MSVMFRKDFNDLYYNNEWKGFFNPFNTKISLTEVCIQHTFYVLDRILCKISSQSIRNISKGAFLIVFSSILFSILTVSILWRFVKNYCALNIVFLENSVFNHGLMCGMSLKKNPSVQQWGSW